MIKVNGGSIATEGDGLELLSESTIALTEVIRRVSGGTGINATTLMFSTVNTAMDELKKAGIEIDRDLLVYFIAKNPRKDETK